MAQGCEATHTARGLAHSEGRKDPGWPHHLLTGRVAHGFLWPLTRRLGKKRPSADGGATAPLVSGAPPHTPLHGSRGPRAGGVGPAVASPGLSVAEKASEHGWRHPSEPLMETPKRIFWRLHECSSSHCLASCLMHGLAQGRMIPSAGGVGPTDPPRPLPRVAGHRPHACACSTERCSLTHGRSEEKTRGHQQNRAETSGPIQSTA